MELIPKVAVLSQHFPQTKNRCLTNPISKLRSGDLLHSRTATPDELQPGTQLSQRVHQGRSVVIRTYFACSEIDRHV
jgi:hypothetical protein